MSKDTPDYQSAGYTRMVPNWTIIDDILAGTKRLREKATTYLVRHPSEDDEDFKTRYERTEFFNAFARTVRGLVGMVFRINPSLGDDISDRFRDHWENIDNNGTHGDIFARRIFDTSIAYGHAGIFPEYPEVGGALSLAAEKELDIRPYWIALRPHDIINWRSTNVRGKMLLSQLTLRQPITTDDGLFAERETMQYRVYRLTDAGVSYEVWEQPAEGAGLMVVRNGMLLNQPTIPLAVCYGVAEPVALLETTPPLMDIAHLNISHWNVKSERRHSLHISACPVPVFKGRDRSNKKQPAGPTRGIDLPADANADAFYMEPKAASLGELREELRDIEQQIGQLGLAMLQRETRAAETAEAKRIDKAEQDSALATAARSLQDALEQAHLFHARYLNEEPGSIQVNTQFQDLSLSPEEMRVWSDMTKDKHFSLDTMWSVFRQHGNLPDDFDEDDERQKLDEQDDSLPDLPENGMPPFGVAEGVERMFLTANESVAVPSTTDGGTP